MPFCHSFRSKESLWKDASHVAKSQASSFGHVGKRNVRDSNSKTVWSVKTDCQAVVASLTARRLELFLIGCGCITARRLELFHLTYLLISGRPRVAPLQQDRYVTVTRPQSRVQPATVTDGSIPGQRRISSGTLRNRMPPTKPSW